MRHYSLLQSLQSSAAIAGDVMQDLKTGHMVGATPYRQQIAEIVGVITGAFVIGPTIALLHKAFQISSTACIATNERIVAGVQDLNRIRRMACTIAMMHFLPLKPNSLERLLTRGVCRRHELTQWSSWVPPLPLF